MSRRAFITLLGGAVAWPFPASAQQTWKLPTIGFLSPMTASVENQRVAAFVQRLRAAGWIEGHSVAIKVRWADGRSERTAEIVAEFVQQKVDVIVPRGTVSVLAAKHDTGYSNCFRGGRPGRHGLCRDGWQCHGLIVPADRSCWQTARTFAEGCPCSSPVSDFGQCWQSRHHAGYA